MFASFISRGLSQYELRGLGYFSIGSGQLRKWLFYEKDRMKSEPGLGFVIGKLEIIM